VLLNIIFFKPFNFERLQCVKDCKSLQGRLEEKEEKRLVSMISENCNKACNNSKNNKKISFQVLIFGVCSKIHTFLFPFYEIKNFSLFEEKKIFFQFCSHCNVIPFLILFVAPQSQLSYRRVMQTYLIYQYSTSTILLYQCCTKFKTIVHQLS
jgi:hypothetical protein